MKKRYSIPKEQCTCGISELYDNVAKIIGVSDLILYGPKADLDGDGYEVEIEDGFVTKGV
jgi:hypothetical protein